MKKRTKRTKPAKDNFTPTEVGALVEQLRSEFSVFGEGQKGIIDKLDAAYFQVAKNSEDIVLLKIAIKDMAAKIDALTESINKLVQTKVDREELLKLENRVSILETKVGSR